MNLLTARLRIGIQKDFFLNEKISIWLFRRRMGASFKKLKNDLGLGKYCISRLMLNVSINTN
jgi:DNA-directed RNA polymerase subunit N (RpoN/RPB10)